MASNRPQKKQKTDEAVSPSERLKLLKSEDPVLEIALTDKRTEDSLPPPTLDFHSVNNKNDAFFDSMIYPVSRNDFLQYAFRKKALHVKGAGVDRLEPILDAMEHLDPAHILRETSSENVFVWLLHDNEKIQSIQVDNPETAMALHKAGHATYCRASPQVEQPMVVNMLRGTGMGCGQYDPSGERATTLGRGEVEVFMGTKSHVTDWHFDFQENFTLQLSGSKKWTLQQGTIKSPLRGCTPHYAAPEAVESQLKAAHLSNPDFCFVDPNGDSKKRNVHGNVVEIVLEAGDMLYFPAGMWHRVETLQPGISINISLMATTYASLFCQALQHVLLKQDKWREPVCSGPTSKGVSATEHLGQLMEGLPLFFKLNFGAEAILPPFLRHPTSFRGSALEEQIKNDDSAEHQNTNGNLELDDEGADHEEIGEVKPVILEANELDKEEVLDVNEFVPPYGWAPSSCKYTRNPLASLLKMKDLTEYYQGDVGNQHLYVLNVNYAGNDVHESAVRVVLKDELGNLDIYIDGAKRLFAPTEEPCIWRNCLVYYGFFHPHKDG